MSRRGGLLFARAVYGGEAMKRVQELLKNATPFRMAAIVRPKKLFIYLFFCIFLHIYGLFLFSLHFFIVRAYECV